MTQKQFIENKCDELTKIIYNLYGCILPDEAISSSANWYRTLLSTAIKEIVELHFQEIMVEKKNWANKSDFSKAPHLDNRDEAMFDQGINQALDQITSRHNKFLS